MTSRQPPRNVQLNDGKPPRILFYGNHWGLMELPRLPRPQAWSFEQMLQKLVEAGFDGLQCGPEHSALVRKHGLRLCSSARINKVEDLASLQAHADAGSDCVTLHVGWGYEDDDEADRLVEAILETSARLNLPAYIEIHRATIAQDLWRTRRLIERIPEIRFNGDFSHLYCGQEMVYPGFSVMFPRLEPILERTCFLHGRISNGQCMQVHVPDPSYPHARNFVRMWTAAMRHWRRTAKAGDAFIFTPELGPPSSGYSITYTNEQGELIEISDRWQQTLMIRDLGREAWEAASCQD